MKNTSSGKQLYWNMTEKNELYSGFMSKSDVKIAAPFC
jgi:hypothetical protein